MKRALLLLVGFLLVVSCSSVKRSQKALNQGDYSEAISIAINKLQKDKTKKANQEHIILLEDAFKKLTENELKRIAFLEKEGNPANSEEIYNRYRNLQHIQNQIKPLLPLYVSDSGKEAKFRFIDYSDNLIKAKADYAAFLYEKANKLMDDGGKLDFREAHTTLNELEKVSPNYKNTQQLVREAYYYGKDMVFVELNNRTNQFLPHRLEQDLLDFRTYGLDDFWTEYHSMNRRDIDYDFEVVLEFRDILISPERILERQIPLEREIKDGHTYQVDRRGNFVLDSLGNKIKIDRFITVKGTLYETIQTKAVSVNGKVDYFDVQRQQLMDTHPLETEFVFENVFARFEGDERVLSNEDKRLLRNRFVPFPTNEQMLLDASDDIKARLSDILKRNTFR
tara:strand:+ start:175504 stop:176688 length:1185 start_codon:yes stop_codon:yes gene_type:complete